MNSVVLIGRLTRDPELRYTSSTQMAVASFTIAVDRPTRSGGERQADFPRITVFGKQAENCDKYLAKGRLVAVQGRLQTGSYQNKNGDTVYTTDVIADRVQFLEWGDRPQSGRDSGNYQGSGYGQGGGYQPGGNSGKPQGSLQSSQPNMSESDGGFNNSNTQGSSSGLEDMPPSFEAIEDDLPF
ncbi:MAG: single-stranded DNA-binding protein [Clostridiales bacterium]|nr:single-stranded DNA-binding protein [Clostridiales bacterium]MDD7347727.1 single-stranded DNA-binding protein [Clostridiales bacterium]MDY4060891.1 single-stranded DNA-binding protein [Anaerovoracaceae bacterium]